VISVVVPILNEARTVASVVEFALASPGVAEVIVLDDGSVDDGAERARAAGARVVTSTILGKGASMEDGLRLAKHDVIVYLDGDLEGLAPDLIERLTAPILADEADFVKGAFSRAGGRVTTLTAKPLLQCFFPELAHLEQPLGGIVAAKRSLLERMTFETDYGADVALVLDASAVGARIAQVDVGRIVHDSQPLAVLGDMAKQVVRVILDRADRYGRLRGSHIREVAEIERHTQAELATVLAHVGAAERLALLPVDGVIVEGAFLAHLARATRRTPAYAAVAAGRGTSPADRIRTTAAVFEGVKKATFLRAARSVPLGEGVVEAVVGLRRLGFRVGVLSGGSRIVADVLRRRVFADFAVGNLIRFRREKATGDVVLAPAMRHEAGCDVHDACTSNVVLHLRERLGVPRRDVLVLGRLPEHVCLLRAAGIAVALHPAAESVVRVADRLLRGSIAQVVSMRGVATRSGGTSARAPAARA
jgi:phosphoserine phosphatase